jgi:hypothetical protein
MQELVDYADVRRVLPVTRIRLRAMDLQEPLTYMTNGSPEFRWHRQYRTHRGRPRRKFHRRYVNFEHIGDGTICVEYRRPRTPEPGSGARDL